MTSHSELLTKQFDMPCSLRYSEIPERALCMSINLRVLNQFFKIESNSIWINNLEAPSKLTNRSRDLYPNVMTLDSWRFWKLYFKVSWWLEPSNDSSRFHMSRDLISRYALSSVNSNRFVKTASHVRCCKLSCEMWYKTVWFSRAHVQSDWIQIYHHKIPASLTGCNNSNPSWQTTADSRILLEYAWMDKVTTQYAPAASFWSLHCRIEARRHEQWQSRLAACSEFRINRASHDEHISYTISNSAISTNQLAYTINNRVISRKREIPCNFQIPVIRQLWTSPLDRRWVAVPSCVPTVRTAAPAANFIRRWIAQEAEWSFSIQDQVSANLVLQC